MVDLNGAIRTGDIRPIVGLLAELRQSGTLRLANDGWSARLDFRDGRVVAASFADERGLGALTGLGLIIDEAEFVFEEARGSREEERAVIQESFGRILKAPSGMALPPAGDPVPVACPKLGFADDRAAHFWRPTPVHRCWVSGSIRAVSMLEQHELCLSGRYESCPRLHTNGGETSALPAAPALPLEAPDDEAASQPAAVRAAANELIDRLLPPVAMLLAIAALIAVVWVLVQPLIVR